MENPLFRIWVNKDLAEMEQRELELSEEEWYQMQCLCFASTIRCIYSISQGEAPLLRMCEDVVEE